jgi:hypothetical protein
MWLVLCCGLFCGVLMHTFFALQQHLGTVRVDGEWNVPSYTELVSVPLVCSDAGQTEVNLCTADNTNTLKNKMNAAANAVVLARQTFATATTTREQAKARTTNARDQDNAAQELLRLSTNLAKVCAAAHARSCKSAVATTSAHARSPAHSQLLELVGIDGPALGSSAA